MRKTASELLEEFISSHEGVTFEEIRFYINEVKAKHKVHINKIQLMQLLSDWQLRRVVKKIKPSKNKTPLWYWGEKNAS